MTENELNVINKVTNELDEATSVNTINKVYRQARNWARYHCYYEGACTPKTLNELNRVFKSAWKRAVNRIGGTY